MRMTIRQKVKNLVQSINQLDSDIWYEHETSERFGIIIFTIFSHLLELSRQNKTQQWNLQLDKTVDRFIPFVIDE